MHLLRDASRGKSLSFQQLPFTDQSHPKRYTINSEGPSLGLHIFPVGNFGEVALEADVFDEPAQNLQEYKLEGNSFEVT